MNCEEKILEDIVGMVHGEVGEGRCRELRGHIEGCPSCREFHESSLLILDTYKRIQLIEPSAQFRIRLEGRVREAIAQEEAKGDSFTHVSVALTEGEDLSAPGGGGGFSKRPSFSIRPVESPQGWGWRRMGRPLLSAVAIVTVALMAIYFIRIEGRMPEIPAAKKGGEVEFRAAQRKKAPLFPLELKDNQIVFPPELEADLDDRGMNILIASDLRTHEHCLVLFTGEQWKGRGAVGVEPLKASFDGRVLAIPARLASRILGGAKGQVAVLRLKDRIEIWSKESLDRYFHSAPEIQLIPTDPQTPKPESSPIPSSSFPIEIGPA